MGHSYNLDRCPLVLGIGFIEEVKFDDLDSLEQFLCPTQKMIQMIYKHMDNGIDDHPTRNNYRDMQ